LESQGLRVQLLHKNHSAREGRARRRGVAEAHRHTRRAEAVIVTFCYTGLAHIVGADSKCGRDKKQVKKVIPKRRQNWGGSSYSRNGADDQRRGDNNGGWLDFGEFVFGIGNSRLAYQARVRDGCCYGYTEGSYVIFKVFKPEDRWRRVGGVEHVDVEMQRRVRSLAEQFNEECTPTKHGEACPVICRDAALGCFQDTHFLRDQNCNRFRVDEGTTFLLEREIRGDFTKFSSNSGWNSGIDPILEAFSHWSWVKTGGGELVCDLQGHRGNGSLPYLGQDYYYLLTDPAICSSSRIHGESDLGSQGINAFFNSHTCNEWCEHLDIDYERPQYSHTSLPRAMSTSYHSLVAPNW